MRPRYQWPSSQLSSLIMHDLRQVALIKKEPISKILKTAVVEFIQKEGHVLPAPI